MAITTTTIAKAPGWARTDVILQLEEAFVWLGWHGGTRTGIVTSCIWNGGGTVGSSSTDYYDVFPATTSGIGTGASFYIGRSGGVVNQVYVNRPGYGYTDGEFLTLSAEDIGESANGAVSIGITVQVDGGVTPVGYGSTATFYDKDVTANGSYPWGVLRHTIQEGKEFGDTYRIFQVINAGGTNISIDVCSGFHPYDGQDLTQYAINGVGGTAQNGYSNRLAGNIYFDMSYTTPVTGAQHAKNIENTNTFGTEQIYSKSIASSNSYGLDLNIYRSNLDPKFAVLSYRQPSLSSTKLRDNTFFTFVFHNFTTDIWDLDELFLGGVTEIFPSTSEDNAYLEFRTYGSGNYGGSKRCAEFGYMDWNGGPQGANKYKSTTYQSTSNDDTYSSYYSGIYVRNNNVKNQGNRIDSRGSGGYNSEQLLSTNTEFNAVIKGIPLQAAFVPSPYYMPDDFVLIDFDNEAPSANIQQGDTITVSGSEVYTVIQGSYNQTNRTRGILFCARTT